MFEPLPKRRKFDVILADPPWKYGGPGPGGHTFSASDQYPCLTLGELKQLQVDSVVDERGALLFMWTTTSKVAEAVELMAAWGFEFRTVFQVWIKACAARPTAPVYRPGFYSMNATELMLLGKRGPLPRGFRRFQKMPASVLYAPRGRHSQKPVEAYERIEALFDEDKGGFTPLELFARNTRKGWSAWGNEAPEA